MMSEWFEGQSEGQAYVKGGWCGVNCGIVVGSVIALIGLFLKRLVAAEGALSLG
ncbi:MAG: hypothetical protein OEV01_10720 [Nitrospira sp.]|nr:hypothetical protein [Nitrospira sp.]MDH4304685.1 hypothetical protein [Nitrospira sp.]MDH5192897.1 hypothetical protein [Nitrospira sp.]